LGQRGEVHVNHDPISRATPGGAATDRRTGVGSLLRASRLRCGEELDTIAQVLRIRHRHIQAIEDGNFDQLPGATYAVGFIRAYADYLGLDSDEVVRRFKEEQTLQLGRPPKADLVFPAPMTESGIPRGAIVFLGVLVGVFVYGAWYSSTVDNDFFKQWIEPVPARLAALLPGGIKDDVPDHSQAVAADKPAAPAPATIPGQASEPAVASTAEPVQETAQAPAAASVQPAQDTRTAELRAPAEPAAPAAVQPETADQTAPQALPASVAADAVSAPEAMTTAAAPVSDAAAGLARAPASIAQPVETAQLTEPQAQADTPVAASPESTPAPAAAEVASTPTDVSDARIILTAVSDSWVEVREQGTDTWVWGKLLRTGESYAVPDRPDLKLKTGNAGGLTISVDGTGVPPVGASGEVVRNVLLDPERLKAGTAVFH